MACGERCVPSDDLNCGACGVVCATGTSCAAGSCVIVDAGAADAAGDADSEEGASDAADGDADCTPPFDTPGHCGDCVTECSDAAPLCAPNDAGFACVPCPGTEQYCGGSCVDLTGDPSNCGGCGIVCPTQICEASLCVGSTHGAVVFIGHDYLAPLPSLASQARILANAVLLGLPRGLTQAIPVLSYEQYADATAVQHVKTLVMEGVPRAVVTSTRDPADVESLSFTTYSVLLVADQPDSAGVDLFALGGTWATALASFTSAGGIVVFLDGGTGAAQMPAFVTATGLLDVMSDAPIDPPALVDVWAWFDAVGTDVAAPYKPTADSVTVTTEPDGMDNVRYVAGISGEAGQSPVVVQKGF